MTKNQVGMVMLVCARVVAGGVRRPAAAADGKNAPSYAGPVLTRATLSGDWGGSRDDLATKGVTFESSVTQVTQGVVDGGKYSHWEYGGRGDLTIHLETPRPAAARFCIWPVSI